MAKPQPRVIPSDDCAVEVDGVVYHPHEGETVTMWSGQTIGEQRALMELQKIGTILQVAEGDPTERKAALDATERWLRQLCAGLATRVVAWTWTDLRGNPMPQPDGTPEAFERLDESEIMWLVRASKGETATERKNASGPSETTSSGLVSVPTGSARSGSAPRRLKRA